MLSPVPPPLSASGGSPPPLVTLSALALPLCVSVDLPKRGHAGAQLEFVLQRIVGTPTTPGILHGMAACEAYSARGLRAERLAWSKRVGCPVAQVAGICKLAAQRKKTLQKTMRVAAWALDALSTTSCPGLSSTFTLTESRERSLVGRLRATCGGDPVFSAAFSKHGEMCLRHMSLRQVREVLERCQGGDRDLDTILQSPLFASEWEAARAAWGVSSD